MDLYGDSFKLQEMIDNDMRTEIDELMPSQIYSDGGQRQNSPTLTSLVPATLSEPMDVMDGIAIDADGVGVTWINGTPLYGFNMDFDTIGGLFVNPQTGLPISLSTPTALSPTITSTGGSVTLNDTLNSQVVGQPQNASLFSDMDGADTVSLNQSSLMAVTPSASPRGMTVPVYLVQNVTAQEPRLQPTRLDSNLVHDGRKEAQKLTETLQNQSRLQRQIAENKKKVHGKANINDKSFDVVTTLNENEKKFPKPAYSYSCLIAMALKNSESGSLPVNEIYNFMTEHFPYFKTAPAGWKNSVRHNLSLNKCFEKVDKPVPINAGGTRKGCLWAMNPAKINKMEEELRKWRSRNVGDIRRSMADPEKLEMLEKGEMKPLSDPTIDDDDVDSDDAQQPVVSSTEEEIERINNKIKIEPPSIVDSSGVNSPDVGPLSLENSIQLDDLELQKGLWDDLDHDRLEFLGDTLSNSSLLNTPIGNSPSPVPTSNAVSFIHCNYVYSPVENENVSSSTSMLSNQESIVTSTGHAR